MTNISNINVEKPVSLRVEVPKIRINIEGFDDISHGGLPRGRTQGYFILKRDSSKFKPCPSLR